MKSDGAQCLALLDRNLARILAASQNRMEEHVMKIKEPRNPNLLGRYGDQELTRI